MSLCSLARPRLPLLAGFAAGLGAAGCWFGCCLLPGRLLLWAGLLRALGCAGCVPLWCCVVAGCLAVGCCLLLWCCCAVCCLGAARCLCCLGAAGLLAACGLGAAHTSSLVMAAVSTSCGPACPQKLQAVCTHGSAGLTVTIVSIRTECPNGSKMHFCASVMAVMATVRRPTCL